MTKTNPLISIIVPVYNTAKYLPRCLNSIIHQTYPNIEIIIVDDGSTDNSATVIKSYTQKDTRIKLVHQKNAGLSAARNTGIAKSTGTFITFVDSDDSIEPNMLQAMITAIVDTSADIAVCSFKEIYPSGKVTHFNTSHPQKLYDTESALEAMLQEKGFMVSATMKLFPAKYFKTVTFPVGKLHEDIGTTYKLIMQASKIVFLPAEYYIYHHHQDSIISHAFDQRKLDIITLTDQMCDDITKKYPALKNVTNERRMRARFSVLRQISAKDPHAKNILSYLRTHKHYILTNPSANFADKLALRLALTNVKLFQLAYKLKKS